MTKREMLKAGWWVFRLAHTWALMESTDVEGRLRFACEEFCIWQWPGERLPMMVRQMNAVILHDFLKNNTEFTAAFNKRFAADQWYLQPEAFTDLF